MKKHRLLFLWLSLLLCAVGARAQELELTVYDGTNTNYYVPAYIFYFDDFTRSQFVIPAIDLEELGTNASISALKLYTTGDNIPYTTVSVADVYLMEVGYTSISAFEPKNDATIVYQGSLDIVQVGTGGELTITFSTPFTYQGGNLLVGIENTTDAGYKSIYFYGQEVNGASIAGSNSGSLDAVTATQRNFIPKTTLYYTPGEAPTCARPTGLAVSDITNEGATLTWDAVEGTSYNLNILSESGEQNITGVTSPYTITGLEAGVDYTVKVQTACSASDVSEWSAPKSFNTQLCAEEDQCIITLELTDSYGDSWNGNAINVVDKETGINLGFFANQNLDGTTGKETNSYTLTVCPGREIQFKWVLGSFPGEASWVIYDVNGEVICEGQGASTMKTGDVLATYTVDCTFNPCKTPKDVTVTTVGPNSATLSWTADEEQSAWEIVYSTDAEFDPDTATPVAADSNPFELTGLEAETTYYAYVRAVCSSDDHSKWSNMVSFTTEELCRRPTNVTASDITANSATVTWEGYADNYEVRYAKVPEGSVATWLQYDDNTFATGIGSTSAATWTWGVMYPGSMVTADKLKKVAIYEKSGYNTEPITINIYSGGDSAPGTLLYTETVTPLANDAMHEITLATPVVVTPGENVWITLTEFGTYVMSSCASNEPNNNWVCSDGSWFHIGEEVSSLAGYGWMIRGYIDDLDYSTLTWTSDESTTESYNVEGLDSETSYVFQVRAKCDEETFSKWVETSFTTSESSAAPEINVTDVTATAATVDWTDSGIDPTSWDVRYKPTVSFETGELPEGWTTIDADGDGYNWEVTETGDRSNSGNYSVSSASYVNNVGAVEPDNWLISPEVTLGGSLSFYAAGQDASWAAEHFAVYVSTTGNTAPGDFVKVAPETDDEFVATGLYQKYTVDLSQFNGKGYVAIRHFNITDMFRLNIDDISIVEPDKQEWTELDGQTSHPVALEELTPATGYEVQVRTHFNSGDDSEWASACFATGILLELADDGTDNSSLLADYNEKEVVVILTGRTLYRDTKWNTICLPFDVALEGSVLEGAIVKPLANATVTDKHVSLTFGDAVNEIEAGVPYIIKWEETGEDIMNPMFVGVTINDTKPQVQDFAVGQVKFIGYYDAFDITADDSDIWYMKSDNTLTHTAKPRTLKAFRTYFQLSEELSSGVNSFSIDFGDGETSTGITEIADSSAPEGYFNLQGVKFDNAPKQKGVYIVNGQKVVVK